MIVNLTVIVFRVTQLRFQNAAAEMQYLLACVTPLKPTLIPLPNHFYGWLEFSVRGLPQDIE
jgi:hypothetical protein